MIWRVYMMTMMRLCPEIQLLLLYITSWKHTNCNSSFVPTTTTMWIISHWYVNIAVIGKSYRKKLQQQKSLWHLTRAGVQEVLLTICLFSGANSLPTLLVLQKQQHSSAQRSTHSILWQEVPLEGTWGISGDQLALSILEEGTPGPRACLMPQHWQKLWQQHTPHLHFVKDKLC